MTRYKVIVNPVAGRGAGEKAIPRISQLLQERGLSFDLVRTERPWHAADLSHQASQEGYDVVVAAGGDGTANEVLNGLMRAKTEAGGHASAMGVLTVGRGNDFGFGIGLPADLPGGCAALAGDTRRTIDIGMVTGDINHQHRYFGNGVGIGFDAVVGFEALKMRRVSGSLSYVLAALKTIILFSHAPLVRIEYDGNSLMLPALMVSVMNGRRMGGQFMMGPLAKPDDGLLDLCIARQVSRIRVLALIPRFMKGTQATHPAITTGQARSVTVTAIEGALPAHADGETLCTFGTHLKISLLPQQLDVVVQGPPAAT